jgi:hypothetical protein
MNDWPDGVSICKRDSPKQLVSWIENNSPYSLLYLVLKNEGLTRWSIYLLMRFTKTIGVSNWKQFSVLHMVILFWKWITDQMGYRFASETHENNWSLELKTILRTPYWHFALKNGWLTRWSIDLLMRFTKTIGVSNWKQFSVLQISTLFFKKWMTDQMEYRFTNENHEYNWSLELVTILRTPYCDFVLKMDDWPDRVLNCWWDSRKRLESRIENNSPYSILWFYFGNGWLTWWSIDWLMRFTKIIGVSN